jgi:serine/threonine protein kinase
VPTEFHLRVQRVLEATVRVAPAERDALLRTLCGEDTRLCAEVRSLLPHYLDVAEFEPVRGDALPLPGTTTFVRVRAEADAVDGPEAEPVPPFTIDQYTAVRVLGRGGMGIVYHAVNPVLQREVAVKVLRRRLLASVHRWRFAVEEEILRQLRHPGIARFSHSGLVRLRLRGAASFEEEERPYFVMEYVAGKSLTRYAEEHELDVRGRLALMAHVCEAVEYAHYRGIVHCDLKPDNILVTDAGQPKVVDFGVANLAACEELSGTAAAGVAGTLPYASPEQLMGRADQIAPASDVYALAIITHELLVGVRPQRVGWRVKLGLQAVRLESHRPPDEARNQEFRYYLQGILAAAVRQARGRHYRSAGELGRDLQLLLAQYPTDKPSLLSRIFSSTIGLPEEPSAISGPLNAVLRKRIGMNVRARLKDPTQD